jgi:hypothetical protein
MTLARLRFVVLWHAAWVGVFWDVAPVAGQLVIVETRNAHGVLVERLVHPWHLHIYLCLIPFVALHAEFALGLRHEKERAEP